MKNYWIKIKNYFLLIKEKINEIRNQIIKILKQYSETEVTLKKPQTKHFKLSEFHCHNGTTVPQKYYKNIQLLMDRLEKLRTSLEGSPITIMSGYRTPAYNKKVGGFFNVSSVSGYRLKIFII